MARLTSRDYKRSKRRPLDLGRWREFGYGLLAGGALAGLAYLYTGRVHKAAELADAPHPEPHRAAPADGDPAGTAPAKTAQKYDFYQMLPNFEVVVPEKDKEVKRDQPAGAPIERPGTYVLQAGSYRNKSEADRVQKQLSLQGVDAKEQRVAVDADVWYRVRIGPLTNLDQLNKVRKQLQAAEVDALVIRVGD
jgi:cell division protein FtsN